MGFWVYTFALKHSHSSKLCTMPRGCGSSDHHKLQICNAFQRMPSRPDTPSLIHTHISKAMNGGAQGLERSSAFILDLKEWLYTLGLKVSRFIGLGVPQGRTCTVRLSAFIHASAHSAYMSAPVSSGGQRLARSARSTSAPSSNFRVNARSTLCLDSTSSAARSTPENRLELIYNISRVSASLLAKEYLQEPFTLAQ